MTEMTGSITSNADIAKVNVGGMGSSHLSIRSRVIAQVQQVADEQEKQLRRSSTILALLIRGSTRCASRSSLQGSSRRWESIPSAQPRIMTFP